MNDRFPLLAFVSILLRLIGWVVVVVGVILVFLGLTSFAGQSPRGQEHDLGGLLKLVGGFVSTVTGLFSAAAGEVIGVLFAIEANTRSSAGGSKAARVAAAPPFDDPNVPLAEDSPTGDQHRCISCPQCQQLVRVPIVTARAIVRCPHCKARQIIDP